MFKMSTLNNTKPSRIRLQILHVDTLREAEALMLKAIQGQFDSEHLVVVDNGNLTYNVHEVFEPIATVKIKTT